MEVKHYKIKVSGKVQGVFYRASALEKAGELGVKGFVRNEHNGDVYMEAEATEEVLFKFVKWCNTGPSRARVENVAVTTGNLIGYTSFEIRR